MTQQIINVGAAINDGTGDPARTAFTKSNDNFTELYASVPAGAWTPWSPTVESSIGVATITVNRARYVQLGKTIIANLDFTVTAAGTGSGRVTFTLPVAASASGGGASYGRETAVSGLLVGGDIQPSATVGNIVAYNGTTPVATGFRYDLIATYERS